MVQGSYSLDDLLVMRTSAKSFGVNTIADVLRRDLSAHNQIVTTLMSDLVASGTNARSVYGSSNDSVMVEVDEFGRAANQKNVVGSEVGFPLRLFQFTLGWNSRFLESATVADLAEKQLAAERAHLKEIQRQVKRAVFGSSNFTFSDMLVDRTNLYVKRFVNADGMAMPDGPNNEVFDASTHTHFSAATPLVVANLTSLIFTVLEHGHAYKLTLAINVAQESTVRAMSGFVPYVDPRLVYRASDTPGNTLDITKVDNRAIGLLGAAEVWVKSWCPPGYQFCYDAGDARKPLYMRYRSAEASNLRLVAEYDTFPLHASAYEAEFGIGVLTRTNGACNFVGAAWEDASV